MKRIIFVFYLIYCLYIYNKSKLSESFDWHNRLAHRSLDLERRQSDASRFTVSTTRATR